MISVDIRRVPDDPSSPIRSDLMELVSGQIEKFRRFRFGQGDIVVSVPPSGMFIPDGDRQSWLVHVAIELYGDSCTADVRDELKRQICTPVFDRLRLKYPNVRVGGTVSHHDDARPLFLMGGQSATAVQ